MKTLLIASTVCTSLVLLSGCREEHHHSHNSGTVMGTPYNDPYYDPNQPTGGGGSQVGGHQHSTGGGGSQGGGGHQHSTGGGSQTGGGGSQMDSPYYRGPSQAIP